MDRTRTARVTTDMHLASLATLLVATLAAKAGADTPKPPAPDLVVTWTEGEMSRDMSIWQTTITVTGAKLHYARTYSGRDSGMPRTKPTTLDAKVRDPQRVAAALAALDKIKLKPDTKRTGNEVMLIREGCVIRGKTQRCAHNVPGAPDPAELTAIAAIRDALLIGVNVPLL